MAKAVRWGERVIMLSKKPRLIFTAGWNLWTCMGLSKKGSPCLARDFEPYMAYLMWREVGGYDG